jgi:hypothetical protein
MTTNSPPHRPFPYNLFFSTSIARNGDGFHAGHGKPTNGPGQWTLDPGVKLPPRSFEVHPRERYRFHKKACAAPLDWQGFHEIQQSGGEIFDATYGAEKLKFEYEIDQAQLEVDRFGKEHSRLNVGLDVVPAPPVTGRPATGFPPWFSLKWWVLVVLFLLFGLSSAAALWNIGNLYLPTAQSQTTALLIATPWVLAAIGAKIFTRTLKGRAAVATKTTIAFIGLTGLVLWLLGMMPLAAGLSLGDSALGTLLPDRRLAFVGQLLCELGSGFLFLTGIFEIIEHRSPEPVADEVDEIHERLSQVHRGMQFALSQVAKAKGNLLEWESSRAAFIGEGITIFHLRQGDAVIVAELQRQRSANQNLLDEFIAKPPPTDEPSSAVAKVAGILIAACLWTCAAQAAVSEPVKDIVIGLSPLQSPVQRESQQTLLRSYLLRDCPNGSHIIAIDGWNLTTIFDVQLPVFAFDSLAARAPKVLPALDALRRWSGAASLDATPSSIKNTAAIKIPQFLKQVPTSSGPGRRAVLLLASPFCLSPEEPSFSMLEKRYPGDGHLTLTTAESIYGIAGHQSRLTNTAIYWAFPSEAIWMSPRHQECVERWWSLYIAGQGGVLAGFGADTPALLHGIANANPQPIGEFAADPADSEMVMHTATNRVVVVKDYPPTPPPKSQVTVLTNLPPKRAATSIRIEAPPKPAPPAAPLPRKESVSIAPEAGSHEKTIPLPVAIQVPQEIPTPPEGDIGIAIVWQGSADIDLRVAARIGTPEAYWNRPIVDGVHHFRDVRASKSAGNDSQWATTWEYCEVSRSQLDQPVVWLCAYDVSGPVNGIIRVQFRGRIADRPFYFNVTRGDHENTSSELRARSASWQKVDLKGLFEQATESAARN